MNNYKLTIAYDGSRYNGWQRQNDTPNTIQQILNDRIDGIVGGRVKLVGAGRTDAGVHARGQCANFRIGDVLPCDEFRDGMNNVLPDDIRVLDVKKVDIDFHARHSARRKCYAYTLDLGDCPNPFLRKYAWRPEYGQRSGNECRLHAHYDCHMLDVKAMLDAAEILVGTHNFKAFCTDAHLYVTTVKKLEDIRFILDGDRLTEGSVRLKNMGNGGILKMEFEAPGFMYNMVRILAGTLVDVGLGKFDESDLERLLESGVRADGGQMAPAKGLCLEWVEY